MVDPKDSNGSNIESAAKPADNVATSKKSGKAPGKRRGAKETAKGGDTQGEGNKLKPPEEKDTNVYRNLLAEHTQAQSKLSALKDARSADGAVPPKDRKSLQERVERLEVSLSEAMSSIISEDSKYHTALQNFTRSVGRMSRTLSLLAASQPKKRRPVPSKAGPTQSRTKGLKIRKVLSRDTQTHPPVTLRYSDFLRHGLANMSGDEKRATARLVSRSKVRYANEDLTDPETRAKILPEACIISTDTNTAHSIVNMVCDCIQHQRTDDPSVLEGLPLADHPGSMSIGEALKGRATAKGLPAAAKGMNAATQTSNAIEPENFEDLSAATLTSSRIQPRPIKVEQPPVRGLSYGLDRVLFNPGVYRLQDLRSGVYNFDPYLEELIPVQEFNFDLLPGFITSSKDKKLLSIAQESRARYTGSSSSMTGVLSQFHFLLSKFRKINLQMLSNSFPVSEFHRDFTNITKAPASIFLRLKEDGVYAIDSDKEFASTNVLSLLGNSLEKLLTLDKTDYVKYRKDSTETIPQETRDAPETYHYTTIGNVLMRSQLDAYDPRLPGTGMFDLKTRAIFPIRMDVDNYQLGKSYEIKTQFGQFESFEREYIDMLRATMIKYMLQVRIGRMDGIYVAFHNTQRIFGFQYIPLEEIDLAMHGQYDRSLGDQEFKLSVKLMSEIMDKATERFPNTSVRLLFRTTGARTRTRMFVFAEPVSEEDADKIQDSKRYQIAAIEKEIKAGKFAEHDQDGRRIIDYSVLTEKEKADHESKTASSDGAEKSEEQPPVGQEDMVNQDVQQEATSSEPQEKPKSPDDTNTSTLGEDEISDDGPASTATLIEDAEMSTEDSQDTTRFAAIQTASTSDNDADPDLLDQAIAEGESAASLAASDTPLLAMELKVQNFVNGEPVIRPGFGQKEPKAQTPIDQQAHVSSEFSSTNKDEWTIDYALREITDRQAAWSFYLAAQKARTSDKDELDKGLEMIRRVGRKWSDKGKEWRAQRDEEEKASGKEKVVFREREPSDRA